MQACTRPSSVRGNLGISLAAVMRAGCGHSASPSLPHTLLARVRHNAAGDLVIMVRISYPHVWRRQGGPIDMDAGHDQVLEPEVFACAMRVSIAAVGLCAFDIRPSPC